MAREQKGDAPDSRDPQLPNKDVIVKFKAGETTTEVNLGGKYII